MGYPPDQPYPEHQSHEFHSPIYQPDYSNHYPSYLSHPYQTCLPETGDCCPTRSDKDWQTQNIKFYPDQTCPDQPQYQPHPHQSFEPTSKEDHDVNSAEGEIEGVTVLQQNVQGCTRSEAEMVMEMQHTYEEQQSNMGEMIRQVALLTVMMKEIQENRAKSEVKEKVTEEGMIEAEKESPANAEKRSEALLEEAESGEIESDEEEIQTEEKSITTPPDDEVLQESLEEVYDGPQKTEEEVIEQERKVDYALFYLQSEKVHISNKNVIEFTTVVAKKGKMPEREPPRITNPTEG